MQIQSLEDLFEYESALVFGIGGSGDIAGAIPTARLLEAHGVEVTLGGVTWEPVPYDSKVGPRGFDEIENLTEVSQTVGVATGETTTSDGIRFKEAIVADQYETDVVLVDVSVPSDAIVEGLEAACETLEIDVVVGVDVGSDVLAHGNEDGLRSPVIDGLGLVALADVDVPTCLGLFGYGSDGELTLSELESHLGLIAEKDGLLGSWGITSQVRTELNALLEKIETTASRLPVEAASGNLGQRTIRDGEVEVDLTLTSTVTFYLDPETVAETSLVATCIRQATDFWDIETTLHGHDISTEFDIERSRLR